MLLLTLQEIPWCAKERRWLVPPQQDGAAP
jgi:hypothetical protein